MAIRLERGLNVLVKTSCIVSFVLIVLECRARRGSMTDDEAKIARLIAALQQAEMDMGVIWMALPQKERETLRIARDRILKALEEV